MNSFFYPKLALTNIRKNTRTYLPFLLTCILTVMMYYIMHALSLNEGLAQMKGGTSVQSILSFGTWVIAIFSAIFLFYTNSFLIKRRKKELGLYNILGMEKKHLAKMLFFETLFLALFSLVLGMLAGMLMGKLMFLLLLKLLNGTVALSFLFSVPSVTATCILFPCIFLAILLFNLKQVHFSSPVQLLKGGSVGEKEPKTKWILTVIGLLTLGSGYAIALLVEDPLQAMLLFFVAVILVIIGTYCLFIAGSVALLKLLRRNKKFYYQTKHFTSVSGMIYRMKQNAAGLANICILSSAVLVMLSTTVCLYIGMEDLMLALYPQEISVQAYDATPKTISQVEQMVLDTAGKSRVIPKSPVSYRFAFNMAIRLDDRYTSDSTNSYTYSSLSQFTFIPLEDYNQLEGTNLTLGPGEILLYSPTHPYDKPTITFNDHTFQVKQQLDSLRMEPSNVATTIERFFVILDDEDLILTMFNEYSNEEEPQGFTYYTGFDLEGSEEEVASYTAQLQGGMKDLGTSYSFRSRQLSKDSFYSTYGGMFFLGIFLGLLFLIATVLIIYYKQVSEGYEDKERFEIMQKVGMSKKEVKTSIHSQVLTVFFLPLVAAIIHIAAAFKMITRLLTNFNLYDVGLFFWCTLGTILIFAVIYAIVYALTAKTYYKIVR